MDRRILPAQAACTPGLLDARQLTRQINFKATETATALPISLPFSSPPPTLPSQPSTRRRKKTLDCQAALKQGVSTRCRQPGRRAAGGDSCGGGGGGWEGWGLAKAAAGCGGLRRAASGAAFAKKDCDPPAGPRAGGGPRSGPNVPEGPSEVGVCRGIQVRRWPPRS